MQGEQMPGAVSGDTRDERHDHEGRVRAVGEPAPRLQLESATPAEVRRDLLGPCGWVMLMCAAVLVGAECTLMGDSLNGQNNGYVETGAAIFLGLAGLRCLSPGVHPVAGVLGVLTGVGVLVQAVFASEQSLGDHVVRYGTGGIAVIVGLVAMWASAAARSAARSAARPAASPAAPDPRRT